MMKYDLVFIEIIWLAQGFFRNLRGTFTKFISYVIL